MPFTPSEFEVLLALAAGDRHGYALMTEVKIGPGTLYTMLERLLDRQLVEESPRRPGPEEDQRRRYYRLTRHGRGELTAEVDRLDKRLRDARRRLAQHA
ncbi:MAG: PadR family transcriptional regulator [Acidobacteria bacterium]|nr:PadR family transcriptional regulator [Acidobacteriota bacterium]